MTDSGNALLGIGYGAGEKRAVEAARKAIENPLLEENLDGAKSIIFAVSGGYDLTPAEVREAAAVVEEIIDPDVNFFWGMTLDESMDDEVKVTIIATGFEEQSKEKILKQPQRDILGRPVGIPVRRESESFITRGIKKETIQENIREEAETPVEDYETPAFIRRSLNKKQ
jgi:cell division protein FtsZ